MDSGLKWTWETVGINKEAFQGWLPTHQPELKEIGGLGDGHKQYGLDYTRAIRIGNGVLRYIDWVTLELNHSRLFYQAIAIHEGQPTSAFHYLYQSMNRHPPLLNRFSSITWLDSVG